MSFTGCSNFVHSPLNHSTARPHTRRHGGSRRGGASGYFIVGLLIAGILVGGLVWYVTSGAGADPGLAPLLAAVERGHFEHIVLEQGEIESSNNVEIRCEIRSRSGGGGSVGPSTSIIDVIAEGERVAAGDWLITFDSSTLEQEANRQKIGVNTAEAIMIQAKALYDTAVIARDEYLKGTYFELRKAIENEIFVAEENLKKAQLSLESIKRQVSRGTLNELQLEGEQFRVQAAQNELDLAKQKLDVLDNYTKPKMLTQLESDIKAAEVKYRNEQDSYQTELNDLKEIEDQIAKCTVVAPQAGQVVYANVQSSRSGREFVVEPGGAVRERQVVLRLPDPTQMQVKASISESRINLIREGLPVSIRIDAFGDSVLEGVVTKVNKYAEPGNWWSSSSKEYTTLVSIMEPPPGIRVGLTAEVQIHVEQKDDALVMPVQSVYERNGKTFCLVSRGDEFETREITIQSTNDKFVALDESASDVSEGDMVVMNPRKHLALFDASLFPADPDGPGQSDESGDQDAPGAADPVDVAPSPDSTTAIDDDSSGEPSASADDTGRVSRTGG